MATVKLTKTSIERLRAPTASGRQECVWCSELKGFGILLSGASATRTFIVQGRIKGQHLKRRVTIGPVNVIEDLDAARIRAREILNEFATGKDPKEAHRKNELDNITLAQAWEKFVAYKETTKPLSPSTKRCWPQSFKLYLGAWWNRPLKSITRQMVMDARTRIIRQVAEHSATRPQHYVTPPGWAAAGVTVRAFQTIFNFIAEEAEWPLLKLKFGGTGDNRRERILQDDGVQWPAFYRAVQALQNWRDRDLLTLILYTGLRIGEASKLKWDDLNFGSRVLRIRADNTKAKRKLDLPMTDQVWALLVARQSIGRESEYIFPAQRNDAKTAHASTVLRASFDALAVACGFRVSVHDLRRGFITQAESCEISPLALKALVNHTLGRGVTEGYVRMTAERLRVPAQKVADRIAALCGVDSSVAEGVVRLG